MGGDQLQAVMTQVSSDSNKVSKLKEQIERESMAVYGSARL